MALFKGRMFRTVFGTVLSVAFFWFGHRFNSWVAHELGAGTLASVVNALLYE